MDKKPMHRWLDRYDVTDPEHINDLETQSAIHEFQDRMPRHEAEKKAYDSYLRERTVDAAAHHLAGMKAAQGAGDMDSARRHSVMYTASLKKLGHPEIGEPPPEVLNKLKHDPEKIYRYKGHDADSFVAEPKEETQKSEDDVRLAVLKKHILGAVLKKLGK
jgi:hypothetical protein